MNTIDISNKLETLIELAAHLGEFSDLDEIVSVIADTAADLFGAAGAFVLIVHPQSGEYLQSPQKISNKKHQQQYHLLFSQVTRLMGDFDRPLLCDGVSNDPRFQAQHFNDLAVTNLLGVPLRNEGSKLGCLLLINELDGTGFTDEDCTLLQKFASITAPFLRDLQQLQIYRSNPLSRDELLERYQAMGLHGESPVFLNLLQSIEAAVRIDTRILLEGNNGTGKEIIAQAIHKLGQRHDKPFVAFDAGAIAENMMESELFGHVKGAFTGAVTERRGLIREADQGTLFMDEISNLSMELQAKLLRVLQQEEVRPVGSDKTYPVNVRVIAATNQPLRNLVERGQFRADLYYRLFVYPINIPTLKERREDIPLLAAIFLENANNRQGRRMKALSGDLLDFLKHRQWPGNVREFENLIERLVALAPLDKKILTPAMLPSGLDKEFEEYEEKIFKQNGKAKSLSLKDQMDRYEAKIITEALMANNWKQTRTAAALSISEPTLRYKMGKLRIKRPSK